MQLPTEIVHHICSYDLPLLYMFYQSFPHYSLPRFSHHVCSFQFLLYLVSKPDSIHLFKRLFDQIQSQCAPLEQLCLLDEALSRDNGVVMDTLFTCWKIPEDILFRHIEYGIQERCDMVVFTILQHYPSLIHSETLEVAVKAERMMWVRYLLNHPRYEELDADNRAFLLSIETDDKRIFEYMLHHPNVDPHEPDNAPFKEALYLGKKWMVRRMLENPYILRTLQLDGEDRRLYTELMY